MFLILTLLIYTLQFFFLLFFNVTSFISQSAKLKKALIEEFDITTNITTISSFTAISVLLFSGLSTAEKNHLNTECQQALDDPFKCCSGVPDSWLARMKNPSNSSTFYQCEEGLPKLKICPSGSFWNSEDDRCEGRNEESSEEDECNPEPVCKMCLSGDFPAELCCKDVKSYYKLQLADGEDCTSYYQCVKGTAVHRQCPEGLHWSINTDRCEWPDQADCKSKNKNSASSCPCLTNGSNNGLVSEECLYGKVSAAKCCRDVPYWVDVRLQNNADCHSYIQCVHGKPIEKYCPENLYWSVTCNKCVKIDKATCNG